MPLKPSEDVSLKSIDVNSSINIGNTLQTQSINTVQTSVENDINFKKVNIGSNIKLSNTNTTQGIQIHTMNFTAEPKITRAIKVGESTGTKDHSKLQNLDYEHSGHTGFASATDLNKIPTIIKDNKNYKFFIQVIDDQPQLVYEEIE